MSMFMKRVGPIEARQFSTVNDGAQIAEWCSGTNETAPDEVQFDTLDGLRTAHLGDWVVQEPDGGFIPCDPAVFVSTYEPAMPVTDNGE